MDRSNLLQQMERIREDMVDHRLDEFERSRRFRALRS
jgi:ribosomal protein S19